MLILRVTSLMCVVALASLADLSFAALVKWSGPIGISARTPTQLSIFFCILFFASWSVAFAIGWYLALRFKVWPF